MPMQKSQHETPNPVYESIQVQCLRGNGGMEAKIRLQQRAVLLAAHVVEQLFVPAHAVDNIA